MTYKYKRIKFKVEIIQPTTGGSITGGEVVAYGENSTADAIVITASPGYVVDTVLVDKKPIEITPNQSRIVLTQFREVKENHKIEATFKVRENPITKYNIKLIVIVLLLLSGTILYLKNIIYQRQKKVHSISVPYKRMNCI